MSNVPNDFLKTVDSMVKFAETLMKLKISADTHESVTLTPDEAQAIVWGLQILKEGPPK